MASLVFSTGTTSMRIGARCERSVSAAEPEHALIDRIGGRHRDLELVRAQARNRLVPIAIVTAASRIAQTTRKMRNALPKAPAKCRCLRILPRPIAGDNVLLCGQSMARKV